MKCTRCGHTIKVKKRGWVNCPKCNLARFYGAKDVGAKKEEVEVEEEGVENQEEE